MERLLAEKYYWTLLDMDRTDMESVITFFFNLAEHAREEQHGPKPVVTRVYADQAPWL